MNSNDFRIYAEFAADKFYRHIDGMQKARKVAGMSESRVITMQPVANSKSDFFCRISAHLHSVDSCEVWFRNERIPDIEIVKYSMRQRMVVLRIPRRILENPVPIQPSEFAIVSDLKFLIRKLGDFYHKTAINLSPPPPDYLPPHEFKCQLPLSKEQAEAVDGVFSYPVSYVWGPPGTGKTRFVLSECVLRYISNKTRILLLAPTNNSVEQMLRGVLQVLKQSDIDLTRVYRMGTASVSFAKEYPEVVGDSLLEKELEDLASQKEDLLSDLAFSRTYYAEICAKQEHLKSLQGLTETIREYYTKAEEVAALIGRSKELSQQSALQRAEYETATQAQTHLNEQLSQCREEILSRCRFLRTDRHFGSARYACILRLSELFTTETDLLAAADSAMIRAKELQEKVLSIEALRAECVTQIEVVKAEQQRIFDSLLSLSTLPADAADLFRSLTDYTAEDALNKYHKILYALECEIFPDVLPRPEVEILQELKTIENELLDISSTEKMLQRKEAFVIAATIDTIIKYLPPNENERFAHVFLDEAGYTSLVRGCVAFSCNCPVTFLGDHYQLPPICEMDQRMRPKNEPAITVEDQEISLFVMPCAYFSELRNSSMSDFYELYFSLHERKPKDIPPRFDLMPMLPLTCSYRFDDTLAQLLSKYVYHREFHGVSASPLEIIILNAPNYSKEDKDRISEPEISCIESYLSFITDLENQSIAALAPYKKQYAILKERLPLPNDNLLTVHRSQGMEFDTVIFSVTDLPRDMFLVNSALPQGRSLLNTAISRTKKRLVVACDAAYWSKQKNQLIAELVNIGTCSEQNALPPAQRPALSSKDLFVSM